MKSAGDDATSGYERYIAEYFAREDDLLRGVREGLAADGLPEIAISPSQGRLLQVLAKMIGARRILELGTLGAYSTIWLARALPPDGRLISLELDPHHAAVARRNVERAGLEDRVEIRVGPAAELLQTCHDVAPFDLAFIDADKDGYVRYLELCLPLVRSGGILVADNTLPDAVLDETADSGTKRYNASVAASQELDSVVVPVFRARGVDGMTISCRR